MTRDDLDSPTRWVIRRYLLSVAVVLVVVVALAAWFADRLATREALDHAEIDARSLGAEYLVPLSTSTLHDVDTELHDRLDSIFDPLIANDSLRGVKVWRAADDGHGTIVYSDRRTLEGATQDMGAEFALFGTDRAMSNDVTSGDHAEKFASGTYEVYVGFRDAAGEAFVFEAYLPTPEMAISRGQLLREWLPLIIGSLVLLTIATLPLSMHLARRVSAAERDRRAIAAKALDASEDERRHLAQRLHDGVAQDLAGVGLALDSVTSGGALPATVNATLIRAADLIRDDLSELRRIGDELFPETLDPASLAVAVRALAQAADLAGVTVAVDISPGVELSEDQSLLAYRVAHEGLRNIARHAGASHAWITVRRDDNAVVVQVRDDGTGFDGTLPTSGHLGLRLLEHAATQHRGRLDLASSDRGTTLTVTVPAWSA